MLLASCIDFNCILHLQKLGLNKCVLATITLRLPCLILTVAHERDTKLWREGDKCWSGQDFQLTEVWATLMRGAVRQRQIKIYSYKEEQILLIPVKRQFA